MSFVYLQVFLKHFGSSFECNYIINVKKTIVLSQQVKSLNVRTQMVSLCRPLYYKFLPSLTFDFLLPVCGFPTYVQRRRQDFYLLEQIEQIYSLKQTTFGAEVTLISLIGWVFFVFVFLLLLLSLLFNVCSFREKEGGE